MRDEDIRIEGLAVTAVYHFENPTDNAIDLQMGFPEWRCDLVPDFGGDVAFDPAGVAGIGSRYTPEALSVTSTLLTALFANDTVMIRPRT